LTGYNIPELTTSGLTHHANTFFKVANKCSDRTTPLFWNSSEIFMDFNFGVSIIRRVEDDIEVKLQVKDNFNEVRLSKTFLVKRDLKYDGNKTRY
jgi:hypothetical protein